jgi:hypothetical protein
MEQTAKRDRRRVIEEIVARWVAKYPERLKVFADSVREMRQGRATENQAMSYRCTVPGDLFRQLDYAVLETDDKRLFDPDGEIQWFAEKFPEFTVPYDRSTLER